MHDPMTEAEVEYGHGTFTVRKPGNFVRCAVTGRAIQLPDLQYWSVARQEAYVDCEAATRAEETAGDEAGE